MAYYIEAHRIYREHGKEALVEWLNEATDPTDRRRRKDACFVYLYGSQPRLWGRA